MFLSSTPRKADGSGSNYSEPLGCGLPKKPRFNLFDESMVHDMSGVEQCAEGANGATDQLSAPSIPFSLSADELFRFQLQQAFQEISDQINRVGTFVAQQIESLQGRVELVVRHLPMPARKRLLEGEEFAIRSDQQPVLNANYNDSTLLSTSRASSTSLVGELDTGLRDFDSKPLQLFYRCDTCRRIFYCSSSLASHKLLQHSSVKLLRCSYCIRRFRHHDQLAEHVRREHFVEAPVVRSADVGNGQKKQKNVVGIRKNPMAKRAKHQQAKNFRKNGGGGGLCSFFCAICSQSFSSANRYYQHMLLIHNSS